MTWGLLNRSSRKSLQKISTATQAGGIHTSTVPGQVDRHLRKVSSKAIAIRKVTGFAEADKRSVTAQAQRMDLFQPHRAKLRWRYEEKNMGRYRKVCDLPTRLRVGQHMAKELLRAQHTPRPHIFDWPDRGGCPAAVAQTREAIEAGYRFLVVADIRDCYEHFDPAFIYTTNLLPPEFVRAALDSREFRYGRIGCQPNGHNTTEHTCPRGLLQGGAASSTLLALALDDLPDHLASEVVTIAQSDNIILACRSQIECEAAATALGRYLHDNPAGTFSPRIEQVWMRPSSLQGAPCSATTWPHRFEQFGYSFYLGECGRCEVGLSQSNLIKIAERFQDYLEGLAAHQQPIQTFEGELTELLAGFPALSASTVEFVSELLRPEFVWHLLARSCASRSDPGPCQDAPPWQAS